MNWKFWQRSSSPMKTKDAVSMFYDQHKMPCCGSAEFLEGPEGGMSTNIKCAKCGARWNVAPPLRLLEPLDEIAKKAIAT